MDNFISTLTGFMFGVTLTTVVFLTFEPDGSGYERGQLDYQRGIIEYELTDTGYNHIIVETQSQ